MTKPATPSRRPSAIRIRIYTVRSDGVRNELPTIEPTKPGACGVPGCTCLGTRR